MFPKLCICVVAHDILLQAFFIFHKSTDDTAEGDPECISSNYKTLGTKVEGMEV